MLWKCWRTANSFLRSHYPSFSPVGGQHARYCHCSMITVLHHYRHQQELFYALACSIHQEHKPDRNNDNTTLINWKVTELGKELTSLNHFHVEFSPPHFPYDPLRLPESNLVEPWSFQSDYIDGGGLALAPVLKLWPRVNPGFLFLGRQPPGGQIKEVARQISAFLSFECESWHGGSFIFFIPAIPFRHSVRLFAMCR